jgi:hypothetical protein
MELDFFTGYHGSGKTYTANALLNEVDAEIADTGPIIRGEFARSGVNDFAEWNRQQESELGQYYDDIIVVNAMKRIITQRKPEHLFVVGYRGMEGIQYVSQEIIDDEKSKILLFEKPFAIMKKGYESRTGVELSDDQFAAILANDEKMGLLGVKEYCGQNPDTCDIIETSEHNLESINMALNALKRGIK